MKILEKKYGKGVELAVINTDKFKSNVFRLCYVLDRTEETVSHIQVLMPVLDRGSEKYPSVTALGKATCELYDADISIDSYKFGKQIVLEVKAKMISDLYVMEEDFDILGGALDFIREVIYRPLIKDGGFLPEYVESEKKRVCDSIRADINSKDRYAAMRASAIAYEGTPLAIDETVEGVEAVTPVSAYEFLKDIVKTSPVIAVFAGNYTEKAAATLDRFLSSLSEQLADEDIKAIDTSVVLNELEAPKEVIETVNARQGRMVLNYSVKCKDYATSRVFNEIFGGSPVSRLFTNVRERLSLCYYCSSNIAYLSGRLVVRSGLEYSRRDEAIAEIERQLSLLSNAENISDEELEIAKRSRIDSLISMNDSLSNYSGWYINNRITGMDYNTDLLIEQIGEVTKEDVADVARSAKLQLNYFLNGISSDGEADEDDEEE